MQCAKRSDAASGFEVLPRRWVVERTLAGLDRYRRVAKDFEQTIAWLFLASVQLLAPRVARFAKSKLSFESDFYLYSRTLTSTLCVMGFS